MSRVRAQGLLRSAAEERSHVLDQGGDVIGVTGVVGIFIDMPLDEPAPMHGDWVATEAGSRYLVHYVRALKSRKHRQQKRYQMRCGRLPKHTEPPADVHVIWLSWYPRAKRT